MSARWLLVMGLWLAGCGGAFTTTLGPRFTSARRDDAAVVYLYRPQALTMAARPVHVVVDGDERIVLVGGYAAMRVSPGKHQVIAYSTPTSQDFVAYGFGPTRWQGTATFDAALGKETFVRLESGIGDVEVKVTDDDSEISSCSLTPGGALR
jgi:hypothetical protein